MKNRFVSLLGFLVLILVAVIVINTASSGTEDAEVVAHGDEEHEEAAVLTLPENAVKISECVPFMGEHWANSEDLPFGPIYLFHEGRVVGTEYMILEEDLETNLLAVDGVEHGIPVTMPMIGDVAYDHTDLGYNPHGHEGYEVPHYDVHFYTITPEEKMQICPPDNFEIPSVEEGSDQE